MREWERHDTQSRIDSFFHAQQASFAEPFAKVRSKRLRKAIAGMTGARRDAPCWCAMLPRERRRALFLGDAQGARTRISRWGWRASRATARTRRRRRSAGGARLASAAGAAASVAASGGGGAAASSLRVYN